MSEFLVTVTSTGQKVKWEDGQLTGDPRDVAEVMRHVSQGREISWDYWCGWTPSLATPFAAYLTIASALGDPLDADGVIAEPMPEPPGGYQEEGVWLEGEEQPMTADAMTMLNDEDLLELMLNDPNEELLNEFNRRQALANPPPPPTRQQPSTATGLNRHTRKARTYPLPKLVASAMLGETANLSQIDFLLASGRGSESVRIWADRVWSQHRNEVLDHVLGDDPLLPRGIVAAGGDYDVVIGLARDEHQWCDPTDGWVPQDPDIDTVQLNEDEIVSFIDVIESGGGGLVLAAAMPLAFIGGGYGASLTGAVEVPKGSKVFAIVDELDRDAVIDLYAVAAGGKLWRRHDGEWHEDPGVGAVLRALKPPRPGSSLTSSSRV